MGRASFPAQRAWRVLFAITTLGSILPLFATRYLPFTDLPEHVAAIATIERMLEGGSASGLYELDLARSQYLLYPAAGAVIARVVGDAVIANQILLAIVGIAWSCSFLALARALERDERVALFAPMVFWNRALVLGFLPFLASVPLALLGLAVVVRQLREPRRLRSLALAPLALALFYTHVSSWVLFGATACALVAAAPKVDRTLRKAVLTLAPLVPSAVAALVWWRAGSLSPGGHSEVVRMSVGRSILAMPMWTFDIWRTHLDEICAVAWWSALAVAIALNVRRPREPGALRRALPFCVAAVAFLTSPFSVGAAFYLNLRLAPLLALFALLTIRLGPGVRGAVPVAMAASAALAMAATAAIESRRTEREMLGNDFDGLLAQIRPGAPVVLLNFEVRSDRVHYFPYAYAGAYHRTRTEAVVSYSFTELPHWPLHYAKGMERSARFRGSAFAPCEYMLRESGSFFEYALVQGKARPFTATQPGPRFTAVSNSGAFTLYARSSGDDDMARPDRSICDENSLAGQ